MNRDVRVSPYELLDDRRKDQSRCGFDAADEQLTGRRVGRVLDRPDALFQFGECHSSLFRYNNAR
jgi:hypothetical protein